MAEIIKTDGTRTATTPANGEVMCFYVKTN